uniref:restriction endonuclease subunit S n=1 Tax=Prevotella sp. TaxID=59823 RepID=UPI004028D21C
MMESYREYKESGVKWLGEIPSHWELRKIFGLFSENKRKNTAFLYKHAMQFNYGTIVDKNECFDTEETKEIYSNYSLINKGDIVINGLNLNYDFVSQRVAISPKNGIITSAYVVISPKVEINTYFYCYLFKNMDNMKIFHGMGTGVRKTLSYKELRNHEVLLPPLSEQDAIVRYLDTATSEIDKAIAMQQKMIDLLNERKQIIIQNAVTKGLDENVEMKESGVEWIGRIPKHWEVVRLSHLTSKIGSGSTPKAGYVESGIIFLRSQNVYCEGLKLNDVVHISANVHRNMSGTKVLPNDVLMNITGGSIGRCFYVDETLGEANVNQHVSIIRPTSIDTHYLKYYLQSYCGQIQVSLEQTGGNREGLTAKALAKFLITYPSQSEQKEIAAYLDSEMQRFDSAITNCQRQITLLQERKQIIINEVVTGKVRVI